MSVHGRQSRLILTLGLTAILFGVIAAHALAAPPIVPPWGIEEFSVKVAKESPAEANDYKTAGGHPVTAETNFTVSNYVGEMGVRHTVELIKNIYVDTARGFVGNALAVSPCEGGAQAVAEEACPAESEVGGINLLFAGGGSGLSLNSKIASIVPEFGAPAEFAFAVPGGATYTFIPRLRADEGYAITFEAAPVPEALDLVEAKPTLCGFGLEVISVEHIRCYEPSEPGANKVPLITNPTRCSGPPPTARLRLNSWEDPEFLSREFSTPAIEECEGIHFEPKAKLTPTNHRADSPTGLKVEFTMPTNGLEGKNEEGERVIGGKNEKGELEPEPTSQANLDNATVTFPKGMSINPAAAAGLGACTEEEVGLGSNDEVTCPESSKIGTVEVDTPIIRQTLTGNVYLAQQNHNPFDSTLGLYLVFSSKEDGITIKVAGELKPNSETGQLVSRFVESPEDPFSRLALNFNEGPRAPLINPPKCGSYAIDSELSPWSAVNPANPTPEETVTEESEFQVTEGPNGSACPAGNLEPKLKAGLTATQAGAKSPFVLDLKREDGTQRFTALDVTTPKGLTAYLKGIPYCPDSVLASISEAEETGRAQLEHSSCPEASQVGTVEAGAGSGSDPFYVPGKVYLAGPYKGAPISLAVVTPAVAGPFDLGNVMIRNALYINPETAQVTAKSDPIPTILHGILLDIRDIRLDLNKPGFIAAPTDCEPMAVEATVTGESGATANVSNRFQVGGCEKLAFKPKLALRLFGGTHRGAHPRLRAILQMPEGDANIASASVALPHSEFLAQNHIRTICTRVQFAAHECPQGSVYGHAEAITPLLGEKLSGPVYLRSSSNPLPDLVAVLRGPETQPIEVALDGRIDSVHGGIRNTFEVVPDAPVTKFTLTMQGGSKGLLENSRDICDTVNEATAKFTAQNGRAAELRPALQGSCRKARRAKKHRRRSAR